MIKRFSENQSGATLAYVALFITVAFGVVGLSFDLGRHYILAAELQKAADAAAAAGAFQLDPGETDAVVEGRVQSAVAGAVGVTSGTPITANKDKLSTSAGVVDIAAIQLLNTIPASDDDPLPAGNTAPYNYVAVTTEAKVSNNVFSRMVGQPATITLSATAVATRGSAICQVTPLFICNPAEAVNGAGATFNIDDWLGHQILVREHGGGNDAWTPGNFGFLNVDSFGNGAQGLANALASVNGAPACFRNTIESKPGQTNGARAALNTRFDMYENPFFGNEEGNPLFGPAENVRKGYDTSNCNNPTQHTPPEGRLPRDASFQSFPLYPDARIGNGVWDCKTYWDLNHGPSAEPYPSGRNGETCSNATDAGNLSRFDVYRHEIDNNLLSDAPAATGETGAPVCNAGNVVPPEGGDISRDRRIVTLAVIDCLDDGLNGQFEAEVGIYINGFLTEPVADVPSDPDRGDIVIEIVGTNIPGDASIAKVIARDWVEVVR